MILEKLGEVMERFRHPELDLPPAGADDDQDRRLSELERQQREIDARLKLLEQASDIRKRRGDR